MRFGIIKDVLDTVRTYHDNLEKTFDAKFAEQDQSLIFLFKIFLGVIS